MTPNESGFFAVSVLGGKITGYKDGVPVQSLETTTPPQLKSPAIRLRRNTNPDLLVGPKLKFERAKSHIRDLESAIKSFMKVSPYDLIREIDAKTGENVYRILVKECIPTSISVIVGDAVLTCEPSLTTSPVN